MYLLLLTLLIQALVISEPKRPKDFIWKNRVLIIQHNQSDSSWFDRDLQLELKERKLLVFQFTQGVQLSSNFDGQINAPEFVKMLKTSPKDLNHWVLIGLDGGVKKSGKSFPNQQEIFRVIDTMPMRQSEIRRNGN